MGKWCTCACIWIGWQWYAHIQIDEESMQKDSYKVSCPSTSTVSMRL